MVFNSPGTSCKDKLFEKLLVLFCIIKSTSLGFFCCCFFHCCLFYSLNASCIGSWILWNKEATLGTCSVTDCACEIQFTKTKPERMEIKKKKKEKKRVAEITNLTALQWTPPSASSQHRTSAIYKISFLGHRLSYTRNNPGDLQVLLLSIYLVDNAYERLHCEWQVALPTWLHSAEPTLWHTANS